MGYLKGDLRVGCFGEHVRRRLWGRDVLVDYDCTHKEDKNTGVQPTESLMRIFVETATGKLIALDVGAREKLSSLRDKIRQHEGTPPDQQSLVFAGKPLRDDLTLSEYNIQK